MEKRRIRKRLGREKERERERGKGKGREGERDKEKKTSKSVINGLKERVLQNECSAVKA